MKRNLTILLIALASPLPLIAAEANQSTSAAAATGQLTEGEVRRVDKETQKITIRHGPIQNLDMPAMSMVFQVKDPTMLDRVKTGDKIKFQAEKVGTQYTVTHIESEK